MNSKIIDAGTFGTVLFHFVACGLPLVVSIAGSLAGGPARLSFAGYLNPFAMAALLVLSGVMLVLSLALYLRGCDCSERARKWRRIGLIIGFALYSVALAGHFVGIGGPAGEMPCH
jgi:hypothetical protein